MNFPLKLSWPQQIRLHLQHELQQLVVKDFVVVDGDVEVSRMQDLLLKMAKINDLQLHLYHHLHVQMLV